MGTSQIEDNPKQESLARKFRGSGAIKNNWLFKFLTSSTEHQNKTRQAQRNIQTSNTITIKGKKKNPKA